MKEERKQEPRRLGDVIAQFLKTSLKPRRGELAEVQAAWDRAVGTETARRSSPVSFRNGVLVVRFESSALRHEIESFRKTEVLERLRTELPGRRIASLKCTLI